MVIMGIYSNKTLFKMPRTNHAHFVIRPKSFGRNHSLYASNGMPKRGPDVMMMLTTASVGHAFRVSLDLTLG